MDFPYLLFTKCKNEVAIICVACLDGWIVFYAIFGDETEHASWIHYDLVL